jgi:hypothetical protein
MQEAIKTLVFELGAKDVHICESINEHVIKENRKKLLVPKISDCTRADFFQDVVVPDIIESDPHLLFLVISNESTLQSYSSELFPKLLEELHYSLIKSSSLVKTDLTSVNIYLFIKSSQRFLLGTKGISTYRNYFGSGLKIVGKHGAVSFKFSLFSNGVEKIFTFSGFSLPSDDTEDIPEVIRVKKLEFIHKIITDVVNRRGLKSNNCIMAGDFGFLLYSGTRQGLNMQEKTLGQLLETDYLYQRLAEDSPISVLHGVREGVNNEGPRFFPTFQLNKGRDLDVCSNNNNNFGDYYAECLNRFTSFSGWPSRILWCSDNKGTESISYDAIDYGNTRKLDTVALTSKINFY